MRILILPGTVASAQRAEKMLYKGGHAVDLDQGGPAWLDRAATLEYDAIILCAGSTARPIGDLLEEGRKFMQTTPVLVYGRLNVAARVRVLNAGADDCVGLGIHGSELEARLQAVVRRGFAKHRYWLRFERLEMHLPSRTVRADGRLVQLSPREFGLLECLMSCRAPLVERELLATSVWGRSQRDGGSNVLDVYMWRLRQKLARAQSSVSIQTIPGCGYTLVGHHDEQSLPRRTPHDRDGG